jgi:hypothetical protein
MAIYEVESWKVKPGREKEHEEALRRWMMWVKSHKELFSEWKSLRYVTKYIAGEETERHVMIWEYDSLAAFEAYKARRKDYEGSYLEYKKVERWKPQERDLWIE